MLKIIHHCTKMRIFTWACPILILLALSACDDLAEQSGGVIDLSSGGDGNYPYSVVIGGGLSETLSVLIVKGTDDFQLYNDVQKTGSGIQQSLIHNEKLYTLCSLSNSLLSYSIKDLSILDERSLGVGNNPVAMAFYGDKFVFTANLLTNTVDKYDLDDPSEAPVVIALPSDGAIPKNPGVGKSWARPSALAVYGKRIFCALGNLDSLYRAAGPSLLAVIDPDANQVVQTSILHGHDTVSLYLDGSTLYAISAGDFDGTVGFVGNGTIEAIDADTLEIRQKLTLPGAPFVMAVTSDRKAYLGNGKEGIVLSFDLNTWEQLPSIDIRSHNNSFGVSFASALTIDVHDSLYVAEFNSDRLFVIDTKNGNRILSSFVVDDGPNTLSILP